MRLDRVPPRTRLLAVLAVLALLAWGLALAGMGRRVQPLAADAGLLEALPVIATPAPPRLGPVESYAQLVARPLFAPDRLPHPFYIEEQDGEQAEIHPFDYVLTSILLTPQVKLAILQPGDGSPPVRVRLNQALESHPEWRLVGIAARSAEFSGPDGRRTLALRVFDGTEGTPPPAPVAAAPASTTPPSPEKMLPAASDHDRVQAIRQRMDARREALRRKTLGQASGGTH